MKNPVKNLRQKRQNHTSPCISILCASILGYAPLLLIGCKEPLRETNEYPSIPDRYGDVSVVDLLSRATKIVKEGLGDQDPRIRANAVEVVASTRRVKLMPRVQRLVNDDSVPVRFVTAVAIADLQYSLAKSQVNRLIEDQNHNVRIAAAYAMSKLGSPENALLIRKAIASPDQSVRANAALLLGNGADSSVLKFLYWALRNRDSSDKVRFNAVEAIARLGDERIVEKIWTMLISAYHDDRVFGCGVMGALGTRTAKEALLTMCDDDVLEVRLAAAEQLGMLGDKTGQEKVIEVFTNNLRSGLAKDDLERVNVRTALAIGRIATPALTGFLPELLQNESKLVRLAAAKAVFQSVRKK
jgi:HEAT repeat protein